MGSENCRKRRNSMETETAEVDEEHDPHFFDSQFHPNPHSHNNSKFKTQLCRRFRDGVCSRGSNCNYAHSISELRRPPPPSNLCRFFLHHKRCTYGSSCRFLHSTFQDHQQRLKPYSPLPNISPQFRKLDRYSSSEYRTVRNSAAATINGSSSAEHRISQTYTAAANASTSMVVTSYFHQKKEPFAVKRIFKMSKLEKNSRIYADWI